MRLLRFRPAPPAFHFLPKLPDANALQVYHLTCAGYTAEHRPLNNKPWFCHFCVSSKARHTVFLHRRRANAPQALVRMHVNNAADLQRLEAMVSVPRSEQEPPTSNKAVKKHNIRLRDSMGAQERLKMCRQKTVRLYLALLEGGEGGGKLTERGRGRGRETETEGAQTSRM